MLRRLREFSRVMQASRLFGQGDRLELRGRLPEARVALLRSLAAVDGVQEGILGPAASSTRLMALLAVTRIASKLKDTQEATEYAKKWLARWAEFRLDVPNVRGDEKFARLAQWESWARQFIAWADTQRVQPTMKLEYVGHAGSDGPLIRLYGRDAQVVGRLRRTLAQLSEGPLALHAIAGIEPIDGCHLSLVLGTGSAGLERLDSRSFVWETDAAGWEQVSGLLEPLEKLDSAPQGLSLPRIRGHRRCDGNWVYGEEEEAEVHA